MFLHLDLEFFIFFVVVEYRVRWRQMSGDRARLKSEERRDKKRERIGERDRER